MVSVPGWGGQLGSHSVSLSGEANNEEETEEECPKTAPSPVSLSGCTMCVDKWSVAGRSVRSSAGRGKGTGKSDNRNHRLPDTSTSGILKF